MIDDFTVLIAYSASNKERVRNFNYVRNLILNSKINLIVCEQVSSKSNLKNFKKFKYSHIYYKSDSFFHKSFLYNAGFNEINSKYTWFLDCDIVLPFTKIVKKISNQKVIRPFSSIYILDDINSCRFIEGKQVDFDSFPKDNFYSKHSAIVRSDIFKKSGGFDENFIGWGWEDLDFFHNKLQGIEPYVVEDFGGLHLWHPSASKENERNNYFTFLENSNSRKLVTFCFLLDNAKSFNFKKLEENLKKTFTLKISISFSIFSFGIKDDQTIKKLKSIFDKYDFLSLFYCADGGLNLLDKVNTSMYMGEGKVICFCDSNSDIDISHSNNLIKLSGDKNKSYLLDEGLMGIKRNVFDFINGYNSFSNLFDSNSLLADLIDEKKPENIKSTPSSFGVRSNLFNYNFANNSFIEI